MKRTANAVWKGGLKDGQGVVSTQRGALKETPYSFSGRFESGTSGTNPEELVAAAHSSCFSMALSGQLAQRGVNPERIETEAACTLDKTDAGWSVTGMHLDVTVTAPGADQKAFEEAAKAAKEGCPISRLLSSVEITMDARLAK